MKSYLAPLKWITATPRMVACLLLTGIVLLSRSGHFGSSIDLPDATLATVFLAGLLLPSKRLLAALIATAFLADAYAVQFQGVSDYCLSAGYLGLIPTYSMVWWFGTALGKQAQPLNFFRFAATSIFSISLAFVVSNAFWFGFSEQVAQLSLLEFMTKVSAYFPGYLGYSLFYCLLGWVAVMTAQQFIKAFPKHQSA
jgi:hypothetical protein